MNPCRSLSTLVVSLAAAALLPAFPFSAGATGSILVYNSFGPGMTFSITNWVVEGASGSHGYQAHAESFVPGISGDLSQIQLATKLVSGITLCDFTIAQDNGSGLPGTVLESFNFVQVANNGVLTLNSVTTPLLQAGQTYWLTDRPVDNTTVTGWYMNNQGITGNDAFATTQSGQNWFTFPGATGNGVFDISVVPVPEPSTAGLVLLCAGLWTAQRRGRSLSLKTLN